MLVKWDPFKELERTFDWWNTYQPYQRPLWDDRKNEVSQWTPAVNVYEDKDALFLELQLPGIDLEDLTVSVVDRFLQVRGERKVEYGNDKNAYLVREAPYGSFARRFDLPASVNPGEAKATYRKGVLTISVPKEEKAKPKVIPIEQQAEG